MTEMAEMGIGNKPCLDIRPSQDQINDRSISYAQLAKGKLKLLFVMKCVSSCLKLEVNLTTFPY